MKYSKKTTDVFFFLQNQYFRTQQSVYMQMTTTKHLSANLQNSKILHILVSGQCWSRRPESSYNLTISWNSDQLWVMRVLDPYIRCTQHKYRFDSYWRKSMNLELWFIYFWDSNAPPAFDYPQPPPTDYCIFYLFNVKLAKPE